MNELQVIRWRALVRVRSQRAAQERFRTICKLLDETATLLHIEPYWKNSALFEINFSTPQQGANAAEVVFGCLICAHALARDWNVSGPHVEENGNAAFAGSMADSNRSSSTRRNVDNLEWLSFSLQFASTSSTRL